jgi:hypothetical protein
MTSFVALAILLLGTAAPQQPTIEQLNSNPEQFDGMEITVSGWIVLDDEKRYIVADLHGYTMWRKGATCLSIINGDSLDARGKIYDGEHVDLKGIFRADASAGNVIRLGLCSAAAIDLEGKPADGRIMPSPLRRHDSTPLPQASQVR